MPAYCCLRGKVVNMALTYRYYWGRKHGTWNLKFNWDAIRYDSYVVVTASEGTPPDVSIGGEVGQRFVGNAAFTIHNVAPHDGGVTIKLTIDWESDLDTYVDYILMT